LPERKEIDPRIQKSKKAIRNALIKLLSYKSLEEITITEVAKEANINRKTFYNNYENVYQVIEEIENDIVISFDNVLKKMNIKENLQHPLKIFEPLTTIIETDFYYYIEWIQTQNIKDRQLISKITDSLKQRVKATFPVNKFQDKLTMELSIDYIIAGMMEGYKEWLQNPTEISLEKMTKTISTIIFSGLNGLLLSEH